ncbi:MAG: Sau3AI family type II restriction endonuclease [Coriobacteriaceae bacterium]|nr:Sau3AI family type II restriction endonuclease [Coriobacteriaceae bacterium]
MGAILEYDSSSIDSILAYAKQLEGHTLRDECPELKQLDDPHKRRGSFGNAVEKYYFHYEINSNPEADFAEVGTELKTTPLKQLKDGRFSAKERLVISMINYMSVVDETWETSSLQKKLQCILLIAYQYDKELNPIDYLVKLVELWGIPDEDIPTFKKDWDTIVWKIRHGRAHELSGSDTLYLEAATKAANASKRTEQPYSSVPAKPRAWAIKPSYMTTALNDMLEAQAIRRDSRDKTLDLLSLVRKRFEPYIGLTENELAQACGHTWEGSRKPKNLGALITKHILGVDQESRIAEFEKAGVKTKTMRVKRSGIPKESISFPTFDYFKLASCEFDSSDFRQYLAQKYLFVVYREDSEEKDVFRLSEVMFWQMPDADLLEARRCYEEMQNRVITGHADRSVKSTENRCCHVRPHGRNKADVLPTPYGSLETKKCFWLNARYVGAEIDRVKRDLRAPTEETLKERLEQYRMDGNVIRVAELFAGVGGFRLGLEGYSNEDHPEFSLPSAGPFVTVWANQWEPQGAPAKQFAARCYEERFGYGSVVNEDIHVVLDAYEAGKIDIPDVDMVVGGFPCQDYSVAKPLSQASGIEGKKGVLWWEIYRFLQLKQPKFCLFENVDRLLKSTAAQRGRDFAIILSCLASLGYAVEWRVVNGADYGFPQKRRRVYIYAERTDEAWDLSERLASGVMAEALPACAVGDLATFSVFADPYENTERFGEGAKASPFLNSGVMQGCNVVTAKVETAYEGARTVLGDILVPSEEVPEEFYVEEDKLEKWRYFKGGKNEPRINKKTGHEYRYAEGAMAFPDPIDAPARTILTSEGGGAASRSKHIVQAGGGRYRRLVPEELEQLQGFPKGWTDTGMTNINRAFCMGNALIVGIPHAIGRAMVKLGGVQTK